MGSFAKAAKNVVKTAQIFVPYATLSLEIHLSFRVVF
jgi:hypothetical protein